ncbi:type VI secretion system baseplate subunit TssG [Pontibacter aydingkolensis]|uniref:Type VI secretion system baseplate subunit TssG n=2 Tax=Pontibacter aydingkolensis TaxID=1911536 RepID=A0ABS7CSP5_9BACT|nr:type VI secretion system baseplate subunit TssG [Pontibacter aydingkolensis]
MLPGNDDVRAEVLAASWIENQSVALDDIIVRPEGTFRRSFSQDVLEVEELDTPLDRKVSLKISREGLYDMLPEGMFHQAVQKNAKSIEEATEESDRYRKEEKAARNFFLPLEQEFYRQRIWLDYTELKYWLTNTHPDNIKMLLRFWRINPKHMNPRQSMKMLSILPHLHSIVGDLQLTAHSLEVILDEKVQIRTVEGRMQAVEQDQFSCLGNTVLGADSVLGTEWYDDELSVMVSIGPLRRDTLNSFLSGGKHSKLISTLYGFFFPAEVEVETTVHAIAEEADFLLTELETCSRLGYSTVI